MKRFILFLILLATACAPVTPPPSPTPAPLATLTALPVVTLTPTALPSPQPTPAPTSTPDYPPQGYGPDRFPSTINPLTGLPVQNPALLERRPIIVKVSNMPRNVRPQWGLSLADVVFEYYTEYGSTRFAAIFYGQDAERVGPIRSARFVDAHLIRMYQGLFAFGSADYRVRKALFGSEFADRLMLEWTVDCPGLCRYEPNGANHLVANTHALSLWADEHGIPNQRPDLSGMYFNREIPSHGAAAQRVSLHYSLSIYNRWEYNPASGRYERWVDTTEASLPDEQYTLLTDALTGETIAADNVIVLFVPYQYYSVTPEIMDIQLSGHGTAWLFRDGQGYKILWQRPDAHKPLVFLDESGAPFALKPGTTWVELIGVTSPLTTEDGTWQFVFGVP